ncbi:hypothetical protein [Aeromicrobium sp. Leaf350]|uniref:hypothetical protein n=1 Tax=Aeromicrobium sp. Leaf350 TaxID=2876565 RepID=UPI001E38118D|nr:hypothetical protein [Aeromicrobium sp. Leaf350]
MTTWRSMVAAGTTVVALVVLAACGGDDPGPEPTPEPTTTQDDDAPEELTGQQLRSALLRIEDIPSSLGTDFESARQAETTGDSDVTDGAPECSEYLSGDYGGEESDRYEYEFRDNVVVTAVYTTIRSFEDGDVDDELEAIRDIFAVCDRFEVTPDDVPIEVAVELTDFADLEGFEDLGEDGLRLHFTLSEGGVPTRSMYYHFIQIGDFVAQAGGQLAADGDPAPFLELVTTAEGKLQDLVDEVG